MTEMTSDETVEATTAKTMRRAPAIMQFFTIYGLQMKLFYKSRIMYLMVVLVMLIPILALTGMAEKVLPMFGMQVSAAYLLILMPLLIAALPAMMAGRLVSSEFKNRTVYMNFPLPMSRMTFFFGKFAAVLTLAFGFMLLAFGFAVVAGLSLYGPTYPFDAGSAMIVLLSGVLATTSMAYGLGAVIRRGAIPLTIVVTLAIPIIIMILSIASSNTPEVPKGYMILPQYAGYQSLWLIDHGIGGPFFSGFFQMFSGSTQSAFVYLGTASLWAAMFIVLGAYTVQKKEL